MANTLPKVDQNTIKVAHAITIVLLVLGFIIDSWIPVAIAAIAQLLGAANVPFAPYRVIYQHIIVPIGIVKPNIKVDNPQPHHFASLVGGLFDVIGVIALLAGFSLIGWIFVWIVIILANLNVWLNFCMGCWMYYRFNRLGIPGFTVAKIKE